MSPSENYRLAAGQLLDCWLSQVEFGENPTFGSAPREPITYNITHQHEVEISEADGDDGQSLATLRVKVDVEWLHQDGVEDVEKPFALSLSVVGRFGWDKAVHDRKLLEAWLEWNGVYLLWPYIRSYVAMITGASSVPTLTIYTMRVPDPPPAALAAPTEDATADSVTDR